MMRGDEGRRRGGAKGEAAATTNKLQPEGSSSQVLHAKAKTENEICAWHSNQEQRARDSGKATSSNQLLHLYGGTRGSRVMEWKMY